MKGDNANKRRKGRQSIFFLIAAALLLVSCFFSLRFFAEAYKTKQEKDAFEALSALVAAGDDGEVTAGSMLPRYQPLYEKNRDFFGWITIKGTDIDYPVMYTPDRPEYYLHRAFDGSFSDCGVPFLDERCAADGNYCLIYGHHMKNKTIFGELPRYADQSYAEKHRRIRLDTLYEEREYEVIAAICSSACDAETKDELRFYDYFDLSDEAVFNEFAEKLKKASLYDYDPEISYGDELLTLSTCECHIEHGRFAVVARRIDKGK